MTNVRIIRAALVLASVAAITIGVAGSASAETTWQAHHPRRTEVNHRLQDQSHRINHDLRDGSITHAQARRLRSDDRGIRQEERDMAHQDGSHITRQEQRTLNWQENGVSRQIHNDSSR